MNAQDQEQTKRPDVAPAISRMLDYATRHHLRYDVDPGPRLSTVTIWHPSDDHDVLLAFTGRNPHTGRWCTTYERRYVSGGDHKRISGRKAWATLSGWAALGVVVRCGNCGQDAEILPDGLCVTCSMNTIVIDNPYPEPAASVEVVDDPEPVDDPVELRAERDRLADLADQLLDERDRLRTEVDRLRKAVTR